MAESTLSMAFRDLRKLGWVCEFKSTGQINADKFLYIKKEDWTKYRKQGVAFLSHNGDAELIKHEAIPILVKYCSKIDWDGESNTKIWVER